MTDRTALAEALKTPRTLALGAEPSTWDDETRTIDVVAYTGAWVQRFSWSRGDYELSFRMDADSADLARYNAGAAVLMDHMEASRFQVGKIVEGSARIEAGQLRAKVKFSSDPALAAFRQDVKEGIRKSLSIGVEILEAKTLEEAGVDGGKVTRILATKWAPYELSWVPVPADPGAVSLSAAPRRPEGAHMPDPVIVDNTEALEAARREGARLEAERQTQIRGMRPLLAGFDCADTVIGECLSKGLTVAAAREVVMTKRIELDTATSVNKSGGRVELGASGDTRKGRAMVYALAAAMAPGLGWKPDAEVEELVDHVRPSALVRQALRKAGYSADRVDTMDRETATRLAFQQCDTGAAQRRWIETYRQREGLGEVASTDLPILFSAAQQAVMRQAYADAPATYEAWCPRQQMDDYRPIKMTELSAFPELKDIGESGVPDDGAITESGEEITLGDKGRILRVSHRLLINDRLDALGKVAMSVGYRIRRGKNRAAYAKLHANPTLTQDSTAVFHADHGNIGTAGAPDGTKLAELQKLVPNQSALAADGDTAEKFGLPVVVLVAPQALAFKLDTLLGGQYVPVTAATSVTDSQRALRRVYDAELDDLSATAYYAFADARIAPCFVMAELGSEPYRVDMVPDVDTGGVKWVVRAAYRANAVGFRGVAKNLGA